MGASEQAANASRGEPDGKTTTQLDEVLDNVPINDEEFAMPALAKALKGEKGESGGDR